MQTRILALATSSLLALGISGACSADQQSSVDCSTAQQDISHLQHEKKSTDERKMKGVFAIMPIGIVVNVATGGDKKMDPNKKMQIDEYNQKIDERIAEIKKNCKVEEPENPAMQSN